MKITVCIRQGQDGNISPFDACAYEAALRIDGAEITLLSMGPAAAQDLLLKLTRLGAKKAILLCDNAFAGADTLATARTLALAVKKLEPDLVLCGRQTLIGDTGQTPIMLSELLGYGIINNVMSIDRVTESNISCTTRDEGEQVQGFPALITVERINTLRFPRISSKCGELLVWNNADIGADSSLCGLAGSPTRVLKTFENTSGKRKCKFIGRGELEGIIAQSINKNREQLAPDTTSQQKLNCVLTVGKGCEPYAASVCDNITVLGDATADEICKKIEDLHPNAVLFACDTRSARTAAQVAARLGLGLCADCTRLECEQDQLIMYRPALSGSVIAKIKSLTSPALATVRTQSARQSDVIIAAGYGVKDRLDDIRALCRSVGADFGASRKLVDNGYARYDEQIGLTGKTVSPSVYVAVGISGAVHHIVGIDRSATVIAVNPDPNAPIFEYADYGITEEF